MRNKIQKTSQEANKQLLHRESNMNKQTGDTTSSDSINPSEESQTSAHNKTTMEKETISVNASQGGAAERSWVAGTVERKMPRPMQRVQVLQK